MKANLSGTFFFFFYFLLYCSCETSFRIEIESHMRNKACGVEKSLPVRPHAHPKLQIASRGLEHLVHLFTCR